MHIGSVDLVRKKIRAECRVLDRSQLRLETGGLEVASHRFEEPRELEHPRLRVLIKGDLRTGEPCAADEALCLSHVVRVWLEFRNVALAQCRRREARRPPRDTRR